MIQAIGLTSVPRRHERPRVDDLTFEASAGHVTVLLGPRGAGKTSALRLVLRIDSGRGVALLRGRPLHRVPYPVREVGVLLGDVPGHPARSARGHLRMLAAVAGVPVERADDLLDLVGLSGLADEPLGTFSLGMDRRLGMAAALLGDPHTLVLDEPCRGLSPRETSWFHGLLRGYADQGGAVLVALQDPREAARIADRVVVIDDGRLVADQEVAEYARSRLRPRVTVSSPHAERLATLLGREARDGFPTEERQRRTGEAPDRTRETVEVVREGGTRLSVYGSNCAAVGEIAYRNGILVHRLADEASDVGATADAPLARVDGREVRDVRGVGDRNPRAATGVGGAQAQAGRPSADRPRIDRAGAASAPNRGAPAGTAADGTVYRAGTDAPRLPAVPRPGPAAPFRYELHRMLGLRATWYAMGAALLVALAMAFVLVALDSSLYGHGSAHPLPLLAGWPPGPVFLLPPAAVVAGALGALAYGQEFTYPALAPANTRVPHSPGLLAAKLAVSAAVAVGLLATTAAVNSAVLGVLFGPHVLAVPADAPAPAAQALSVLAVTVGCAWAGLLAAGVLRSTLAGLVALLVVPLLLMPPVRELVSGVSRSGVDGLLDRLVRFTVASWPTVVERWAPACWRLLGQPVGQAALLSAVVLLFGYLLVGLRSRGRQRPTLVPKPQKRSNTTP
ncbi:ATP-binding cassette domain-containing protein [Streptomyces sp. Z26]|uniref:ATP-binding cassette domain-containing protein n=1 Tax=Streptomyces sp. Z26 TaxID=2500177 RepID=UPI000EF14D6D|nr:ATP-binding cassette domain-containing protein [Streptomyces sp. Z26]RLL69219.1 ATP-binding cassette domain-containing protein [Streptomyces sp. Z26]